MKKNYTVKDGIQTVHYRQSFYLRLQSKRRREELGGLIKKLLEAYATGKIPEKHFTDLLNDYDTE
jgi:hypothetical protein